MRKKPDARARADVLYRAPADDSDPLSRIPPRLLYVARHQLDGDWVVKTRRAGHYNISYLQDGRARIVIHGRRYPAAAGDVFVYRPRQFFGGESVKNHPYQTLFISVDFGRPAARHNILKEGDGDGVGKFPSRDNWKLRRSLDALIAESRKRPNNPVLIKSLLIETFSVMEELSSNLKSGTPVGKTNHGYKAELCLKAKAYMEKNRHQRLRLKEIADHLSMSVSRFCHLFKETARISPIEYLIRVRIDHAKTLLRQPHCRVTQIAGETGFSDLNYFTRTFKRITGKTPSDYRAKTAR